MLYPNKISSVRTDNDKSQGDLAAAAGVSQQMISLYENGSSIPNAIVAELIADALGTTVRYLYAESINSYITEMRIKRKDTGSWT